MIVVIKIEQQLVATWKVNTMLWPHVETTGGTAPVSPYEHGPPEKSQICKLKKSNIVVRMKECQFVPVVISRHSENTGEKIREIFESFTHNVEVVHSQAFSNSWAWVRYIMTSWLLLQIFFKPWKPRRRWPLNLRIMVKFQWSNPNILEVEVSATPKTASVCPVYFRIPSPPRQKNTMFIWFFLHFKTHFIVNFCSAPFFAGWTVFSSSPLSIGPHVFFGGFISRGDLEHTHLVKGLDFALLNKVRAELNKQKKVEEVQSLGCCVRFLDFFSGLLRKGWVCGVCKCPPTKTSSDAPWPLRKVKQQQRSKAPGEKKSRTFEHRIVRMPGVSLIECFRFLGDSWWALPGGITILHMRGLNQETEQ